MSIQGFLFITSFVIAASQELTHGYSNLTNSTDEGVNWENAETRQSDLWLLSRDGPVPVELNRGWSPENGYPGVQTVTSLHRGAYGYRLRGSQSPIGVLQDRSEQLQNGEEVLIFSPAGPAASNGPHLQRSFLNLQDPESVLVELPIEVSSGFWEQPRPQIIQQLSSSGMRVSSTDEPSILQFDNGSTGNIQQDAPSNIFLPNREATSRLPVPNSQLENYNASASEAAHEIPYQTFETLPVDLNNRNANIPANHEGIWFPVQERTTSGSSVAVGGNDDRLLYHISFEVPSQTTAQDNKGLTLTPDDIEILERLGILSFLNLDGSESSNHTESPNTENSQREYESAPPLIDNEGQNYGFMYNRNETNPTDVVFIELPEFTPSQYHGNIPSTAERTDRGRPLPYIATDSLTTPEGDSYSNETSSPVFNGTSLTSEQIQEILQLLGLNNPLYSNETSLQQTKSKTDDETTSAVPEIVTQGLELSTPTTNISAVSNIDLENYTSADASTTKGSLRAIETPSLVTLRDRALAPGLVSSGRIQPRILERVANEGSESENEVHQLISRRMSPISSQKLEMLRKLMIKPKPYVFGFLQNDGNGTIQHRDETADGSGSIKGNYGYRDAWGVYRNVSYIADSNGFHAVVKTNEPGTISHNPADAVFMSELPPQAAIAQMMAYVKRNNSFSTNT